MGYNEGGFGESSDNRGYRSDRSDGGGRTFGGSGRRFGGGRRFDDRPKPVESGKEYDVSITEISRKGDGITRIDGFVIFVKGGQIGQNAKIKVTQVGGRFATAEVVGEGAPQSAAEPSSE